MSYRDDREAPKGRVEQLVGELNEARREHHYHCDRTCVWVGVTTPTQHHPGLINSLASGGP